jgi:hypothetical protein
MTVLDPPKEITDLRDMICGVQAGDLDAEFIKTATVACERYRPEIYLQLSQHEGVYGNPGATKKQRDFAEVFFEHKARIFCACGANQSGKTTGVGACFGIHLRDHAQNGDVYWVMAATSQTLRDIPCKTLWDVLPHEMFGDKQYNPETGFGNNKTVTLHLPGGRGTCELWLWTEEMDLHVVESARLNGVWWTECRREAIYGALQPRLAAKGGWILMDYVPREPWHRTRLRLAARVDPDVHWVLFTMPENAHNLPVGEVERQKRKMSQAEWNMRGLGMEALMEGLVYPQFSEDRHVIKPFPIPDAWPKWRFLDYGFAAPTACGWGTVAPVGWQGRNYETKILFREYYQRGRSVPENAKDILLRSGKEKYHTPMLIDPAAYNRNSSNKETIAQQYEGSKIKCRPWPRSNAYGEDAMVEVVRKELEQETLLVFSDCHNAIMEFQSWQYKRNRDGVVDPAERYENDHNHMLDAIRGWCCRRPGHTVGRGRVDHTAD